MGLIFFGCQPPFFTKSSNCVHGLCRDGMCSDTLELEEDLHLLKSILKGLQVHRCTESFKYFWDSKVYISTINTSICSQSCVWTSARYMKTQLKIPRHWIEEKQRTPTPGTALQQWLCCQTSTYISHFNGKFHQFALQLPKLAVLKTSQELCRLCYYSSKTTATPYSNYFILKH